MLAFTAANRSKASLEKRLQMTIFDFYLLRRYIKIFAVCFISLSGLYVVIHVFTNLEEMLSLAKGRGSVMQVFAAFYGPRVLDFFNQMSAVIALISGIFAFTMLQKTHEVTAMEAAGLSKLRIARPILVGSLVLVIGVAFCRECIIPKFREQLVQNAQDQSGDNLRPVRHFTDFDTQIAIRSGKIRLSDDSIVAPHFFLRAEESRPAINLVAESAKFMTTRQGLTGYLLRNVSVPTALGEQASIVDDGQPIILFPSDFEWLQDDQCFVTINVPPTQLVLGREFARYAPLNELIASNLHPSIHFSNRQRVEVHRRIVQPLLDMTLIVFGLPIVIARRDRNVFFAAGICMLAVSAMFICTMTSHGLGASRILKPPAFAAWLPLIVFSPLAIAGLAKLKK